MRRPNTVSPVVSIPQTLQVVSPDGRRPIGLARIALAVFDHYRRCGSSGAQEPLSRLTGRDSSRFSSSSLCDQAAFPRLF